MHVPAAFAVTDPAALDALFAAAPFATLVTVGADGAPCATQLPVLYRRDGDAVRVEGHWARPNPQCGHAGPALLIVHGPQAYVSPGWYPDKEAAARVPTWNYATAHLHGMLERFDDEAALADLLVRTSAAFEARAGGDWGFDPFEPRFRRQLAGIVGFRFAPSRIEVKHKLSQNHPAGNRAAVAAALAGGDAQARAVAAMMRGEDAPPGA
ncbi:FMN-binding negative transcriptional regulator [Luteimonas sp. Y-2-2-4F]|nr:FMN-binding negative transcriptional regulator [Luteimonas sp. Y-2-2-4F]MCD9032904.1 FMN-binding negative transcriptional regulator [Luteimonas sp. Y-2-2-4F]